MFPVELERYLPQIRELESYPVEKGKIMLYGNSFFHRWGYERARQQFFDATGGRLDVINHGFGGAVTDDLLYYYPRLVTPYAPRAVVIRTVANDIRKGLTPEEAVFLLERLVVWLKTESPERPVLLIPTNDNNNPKDVNKPEIQRANLLQKALLERYPGMAYIDVNGFFYDDPADIGDYAKIRDVYGPDAMHLNDAAYEEMSRYLGSRIVKALDYLEANPNGNIII